MKAKIRPITLKEPVPVYDIVINESVPCFSLKGGIFSHNTVPSSSELREIYEPRTNTSIMLHADYAQNEVRFLAKMANETNLMAAFERGVDVHRYVASNILKKPEDEITSTERSYAKAACVTGDTRIKLLDGRTLRIDELSEEWIKNPHKEYYTYSFDLEDGLQKPGHISFCGKTKTDTKLAIVTLVDASGEEYTVRCTVDHLFVLYGGYGKRADELEVGDRFIHGRTWTSSGYEYISDPIHGGSQRTHKLIGKQLGFTSEKYDGEWVIHHKDSNKRNNNPTNLENVTREKHSRHHSSNRDLGTFIEWDDERKEQQSQRLSEMKGEGWEGSVHWHGSLSQHLQYIRDLIHFGKLNSDNYNKYRPKYTYCRFENLAETFHLLPNELIKRAMEYEVSGNELKEMEGPNPDILRDTVNYFWQSDSEEAKEWRERHSKRQIKTMTDINLRENVKLLQQKRKIVNNLKNILTEFSKKEILDDYNGCKKKCSLRTSSLKSIEMYFGSLEEAIKEVENFRVKSVEIIEGDEVQFYDLTVDDYHNYALELKGDGNKSEFIYIENTFGLLYGKSIQSFASEMMGGDLAGAKKFFNEFFTAFPGIKKFVDEQHAQVLEHGFVYTIFGDPININTDFYREDEVLRRSQNYPIQCLHKSSKINMLDGTNPTIEELSNKQGPFWIYSFDKNKNEYVPALATKAWKSGETSKMIRVTLDNGEVVETTDFHLYMLRDGSYRRADELRINDSLMPLKIETHSNNIEGDVQNTWNGKFNSCYGYPIIKLNDGTWKFVHRFSAENTLIKPESNEILHVHHKDRNPNNNNPDNLEWLTCSQHILEHQPEGIEAFREFVKSPEGEMWREDMSDYMSSKNREREIYYPEWHQNQKDAVSKEVKKRLEETGSVLGIDNPEERSRIHKEKVWGQYKEKIIEGLKVGHNTEEAKKNHSNASKDREKSPEYRINRIRKHIQKMRDNGLHFHTAKLYDESVNTLVEQELISKFQKRPSSWLLKVYSSWDDVLYAINDNHKVIKIEVVEYNEPIPVYDIEVPSCSNFGLSAGIIVHNSSASSLGAHAIYLLNEAVAKHRIRAAPLGFCHDACDWDIEIEDLFKFIPLMYDNMVSYIKRRFGIPVDIDWELGIHQNFMMKLEPKEEIFEFECPKDTFYDIIERMETHFDVKYEITKEKEESHSMKDLFAKKGAFSKFFGTKTIVCEGNIQFFEKVA